WEDIARSLATSESVHAGIGTGAGIDIRAVVRYAGCGGGVAADSSVSNGSVSSADGACDWAIGEASSAYGWSSATISSSACSGPGI
nr:hypothetical protein [Tanacetum cinerariifolium]